MTFSGKKSHRFPRLALLLATVLCCSFGITVQADAAIGLLRQQSPIAARLARLVQDVLGKLGIYYGINLQEVLGPASTSQLETRKARTRGAELAQSQGRLAAYEKIGKDVEHWAEAMLAETGRDGSYTEPGTDWVKVKCNKALKHVFNPTGRTLQYVKWMRDSRGKHADSANKNLHPCMKVYGTIDAPFDLVCRYLSQEKRYKEYNSLLIDQRDVEELTPHSKICWSQTKKLLFIQPRDFVTFCYHKWRKDGTQMIVHQACDHPSYTNNGLRAFALRGATFLSEHPDDPRKTWIILLAHCNCGNDIPEWAVRTAVRVLAPIKPFEIIHRLNVGVAKAKHELTLLEDKSGDKPKSDGRSRRPGGMAQMGYACFWPEGGGILEQ